MQTIQQFIADHGLTMEILPALRNPNMEDQDWAAGATHYRCIIANSWQATMEVPFSQGAALTDEPTLPRVLDCLAMDAASIENARDFEAWAAEFGYDTDSRKAERIFNICTEQAGELRELLGAESYVKLLWETERD